MEPTTPTLCCIMSDVTPTMLLEMYSYICSDSRCCDPRHVATFVATEPPQLPVVPPRPAPAGAAGSPGPCFAGSHRSACVAVDRADRGRCTRLAPARNSFAVFDFENTSHFACSQELHLTFDCSCPVASARRCGLLILLCHRHKPVRCCELLILQEAQTLHRWRCVDQKSGARAFDWGPACLREPEHSYRSICSYRKLPPPACPGTA